MQANRKIIRRVLLLLAVACPMAGPASAQDIGGGLRLTTPDISLELQPLVTERFGIRGLVTGGSVWYDWDESWLGYDGRSRLGTGFLLADWHPYATGFRLSGGLAYSNQRFAGAAGLGAGTININGTHYSSAQVGPLDGRVSLSRASPYLGVGWGLTPRTRSRLYFSADVGVTYQRPSTMLIGHCGPALSASLCAHDIRAEEAELRDAADDPRLYPVISVGFGLRF